MNKVALSEMGVSLNDGREEGGPFGWLVRQDFVAARVERMYHLSGYILMYLCTSTDAHSCENTRIADLRGAADTGRCIGEYRRAGEYPECNAHQSRMSQPRPNRRLPREEACWPSGICT